MPNEPRPKFVALIILDGWGVAVPSQSNAISQAKLPNFSKLIAAYPAMTLKASGEAVGLYFDQPGNSEAGHLNMGAGRIVYRDLPRIERAIQEGDFFENKAFLKAMEKAKEKGARLHLIGVFGDLRINSKKEHVYSLLEIAKKNKVKDVFLHVILEENDISQESGEYCLKELKANLDKMGLGKIGSISGGKYAMDMDGYWDRTQKAYNAMALGQGPEKYHDPFRVLNEAYEKGISESDIVPAPIIDSRGEPIAKINNGDSAIFFNFRADGARQLTKAFVLPTFNKFEREYLKDLFFVSMVEYDRDLPLEVAFKKEKIARPLSKAVSEAGLKQLKISDAKKYPFLTYFFNGRTSEPFEGEKNIMIDSMPAKKKPAMNLKKISSRAIKEILSDKYHFIAVNYSNADIFADIGYFYDTVRAVEETDKYLGDLVGVILSKGGAALVTSSHGNAEETVDMQTGEDKLGPSANSVPFIAVGKSWEGKTGGSGEALGGDLSLLRDSGILSDIAPTILKIMNLPIPDEMTGRPLI